MCGRGARDVIWDIAVVWQCILLDSPGRAPDGEGRQARAYFGSGDGQWERQGEQHMDRDGECEQAETTQGWGRVRSKVDSEADAKTTQPVACVVPVGS